MANDKQGNEIQTSNLIRTIRATQLGKKAPDLSLQVKEASKQLFAVIGGEVKVPRKRATSEVWPEWFEALEAPRILYFFAPNDGTEPVQVEWNEELGLFEGPEDENGKRDQYTGDTVVEMADPDAREVEGTMEALQKLRNAITRFNNKTGKRLATRFVSAQRDSSGRTVQQKELVYRLK